MASVTNSTAREGVTGSRKRSHKGHKLLPAAWYKRNFKELTPSFYAQCSLLRDLPSPFIYDAAICSATNTLRYLGRVEQVTIYHCIGHPLSDAILEVPAGPTSWSSAKRPNVVYSTASYTNSHDLRPTTIAQQQPIFINTGS